MSEKTGAAADTAAASDTTQTGADAADQAQDFSAAFAEASAPAAVDEKKPASDAAADPAAPKSGAAATGGDGAAGSPAGAAEAGKPGAETGDPKESAAGDPGGDRPRDDRGRYAKAELDDTWKDAPEPLRAAHLAALQRNSGLSDQVVRRTRENDRLKTERDEARRRADDLERRLQQASTGSRPAETPATKPAATKDAKDPAVKPAGLTADETANLDKLATEFPEFAPLIEEVRAGRATRNEISELKQELAVLKGRESKRTEDAQVEEQFSTLIGAHPDWLILIGHAPEEIPSLTGGTAPADYDGKKAAANFKRFSAWLDTQPQYVREAAKRNGDKIVDAEAAIDLMDRYKRHLADSDGHATGSRQPTADPPNPGAGNPKPKPDLSTRRQEQLRGSTSVPSRGPAPVAPSEDDFASAFQAAASKAEKEIRAR